MKYKLMTHSETHFIFVIIPCKTKIRIRCPICYGNNLEKPNYANNLLVELEKEKLKGKSMEDILKYIKNNKSKTSKTFFFCNDCIDKAIISEKYKLFETNLKDIDKVLMVMRL